MYEDFWAKFYITTINYNNVFHVTGFKEFYIVITDD